MDSGRKMTADTSRGEGKSGLALNTAGVISYLIDQGSNEYALLMEGKDGLCFTNFGRGGMHFEEMMQLLERNIAGREGQRDMHDLLNYAAENIRRRMVIVTVTDIGGIASMDEPLLKKVTVNNDLLVIALDDAYLTGGNVYDVDQGKYERELLLGGGRLAEAEHRARERLYEEAGKRFRSYRVSMERLAGDEEVIPGIIDLFGRHRYGNHR